MPGIDGEWLVLTIDPKALTHRVVFEAAAPVGNSSAHKVAGEKEVLFPHLYGALNVVAVTGETKVERDADGSYSRILWQK